MNSFIVNLAQEFGVPHNGVWIPGVTNDNEAVAALSHLNGCSEQVALQLVNMVKPYTNDPNCNKMFFGAIAANPGAKEVGDSISLAEACFIDLQNPMNNQWSFADISADLSAVYCNGFLVGLIGVAPAGETLESYSQNVVPNIPHQLYGFMGFTVLLAEAEGGKVDISLGLVDVSGTDIEWYQFDTVQTTYLVAKSIFINSVAFGSLYYRAAMYGGIQLNGVTYDNNDKIAEVLIKLVDAEASGVVDMTPAVEPESEDNALFGEDVAEPENNVTETGTIVDGKFVAEDEGEELAEDAAFEDEQSGEAVLEDDSNIVYEAIAMTETETEQETEVAPLPDFDEDDSNIDYEAIAMAEAEAAFDEDAPVYESSVENAGDAVDEDVADENEGIQAEADVETADEYEDVPAFDSLDTEMNLDSENVAFDPIPEDIIPDEVTPELNLDDLGGVSSEQDEIYTDDGAEVSSEQDEIYTDDGAEVSIGRDGLVAILRRVLGASEDLITLIIGEPTVVDITSETLVSVDAVCQVLADEYYTDDIVQSFVLLADKYAVDGMLKCSAAVLAIARAIWGEIPEYARENILHHAANILYRNRDALWLGVYQNTAVVERLKALGYKDEVCDRVNALICATKTDVAATLRNLIG